MLSFAYTWNCHKQISIFPDIFDYSKVTLSSLRCLTMDPWLKLNFSKHHEIGIWTFLFVFSSSKCRLSPRPEIVISKLVCFEISLIVTK